MSGDPERDGKARPTAPAGVLGGPGKRPETGPVETGARPPKSAFAHTIAMPGAVPVPPAGPERLNVPQTTSDAAEPLRDPSERPMPTPYKRERAQEAHKGTMQMPQLSTPPGARSEQRMIAAKPGMRADSGAVEVHSAAKVGTREATTRTPVANAPAKTPIPAAPPPSGAPPAMPTAKSAAPVRDDHSVPRLSLGVEKIPSGKPKPKIEMTAQSQPLQLSLSASDHVEASLRPQTNESSRSMLPWIAIAVVVILGVIAFAMTRGGDEPTAVTPERVDAVPAVDPVVPTPTPTPTTEPVQAVAPTVPTTPAAPVVEPPKPKPAPPVKAAPVEKPKPAAQVEDDEPEQKASTSKRKKKKKTSAKADPVLKVSPSEETDLEKALRAAERMAEPEDDAPPEPGEPPSPD